MPFLSCCRQQLQPSFNYLCYKKMNITLFITNRCASCDRVRAAVEKILSERREIKLHIEDIKKGRPNGIIIVPALFIEDELYAYGDLDEEKFLKRIKLVRSAS